MDLTPKYLGDDLVLLPGLTEDEAERVMSGGTQGNTSPFYSLERWKPNIRTENRMVWVHWGIPPPAWDRNRIRQIVAIMGDMVDVDEIYHETQQILPCLVVSMRCHVTISCECSSLLS